jgi:NTP pyrophosphatase (non-canonical NTP hydrolase)
MATSAEIGAFVDAIAGKTRSPSAVAGRLLEEAVELALAAGLSTGEVLSHVADSLHNQALKASATSGVTVFPSKLAADPSELAEECADVSLILKDLCHVAAIDLAPIEAAKWSKFKEKKFRVSETGTLYAIKPHINPDSRSLPHAQTA